MRLISSSVMPRSTPARAAQQIDGFGGQIVGLGGQIAQRRRGCAGRGPVTVDANLAVGIERGDKRIEQTDGHHERFDLMEAIAALGENLEEEIQLGRCPNDRARG